jgi:hypothetical protein
MHAKVFDEERSRSGPPLAASQVATLVGIGVVFWAIGVVAIRWLLSLDALSNVWTPRRMPARH